MSRNAVLLIAALLLTTTVVAQNTRSAVSITGVDTATCTVPDPCRTFGVALGKTNAGGEIVALSSGGYGAVIIDKAVAVIAPPAIHAAIAPTAGTAITVNAADFDQVVLRNLYMNSQGGDIGIDFNSGVALHVEGCVINGFNGTGTSYGIDFQPATADARLYVIDSVLRQNSEAVRVVAAAVPGIRGTLDNVRLNDNNIAVRTFTAQTTIRNSACSGTAAGIGIYADSGSKVMVENTVVTQQDVGYLASSGGKMTLSRCAATSNNVGIESNLTGSEIWISDSTIASNGQGVVIVNSAAAYTRSNNTLQSNNTNVVGTLTPFTAN